MTIPWVDAVLHELAPIYILLDWLVDPAGRRLPVRRGRASGSIFPAVYLVYSLLRGPIADWYPYPFLDPAHGSLGYWNVAITSVGILVTIVVLARCCGCETV